MEDVNVVERALENIEFSEPETFCSPYKSGIGYSERIIFLDASGELCVRFLNTLYYAARFQIYKETIYYSSHHAISAELNLPPELIRK